MIEMHFKASSEEWRQILEQLNFAMCEALVGSESFEKGDEMFITPVEEVNGGYGFIAYFGRDDNRAPTLVFEDNQVIRIDSEGTRQVV